MSDSINTSFYRVSGGSTIEETISLAEAHLGKLIADAIATTGYVSHSVSSVGIPRSTWTLEYPSSESPWKVFRAIFKRKRAGASDFVVVNTVYFILDLPEVSNQ